MNSLRVANSVYFKTFSVTLFEKPTGATIVRCVYKRTLEAAKAFAAEIYSADLYRVLSVEPA